MCTDSHSHAQTHTAREMLCYTTQCFSDKRRQVNATGSHVVNTDISLLYVWVCVCDITHLRIYKNVFKMINMRCLRSLCGWIQWTWLQPCCTHIHRQHQKYWSINISRLMHIYETISYWEPCACLVSESKLYLSFLIYFSNYC